MDGGERAGLAKEPAGLIKAPMKADRCARKAVCEREVGWGAEPGFGRMSERRWFSVSVVSRGVACGRIEAKGEGCSLDA